jgi:hypothetical protein
VVCLKSVGVYRVDVSIGLDRNGYGQRRERSVKRARSCRAIEHLVVLDDLLCGMVNNC